MDASRQPIESLPFLRGAEVNALLAAQLATVEDLLSFYPRRYEDRKQFSPFPSQPSLYPVSIRGIVIDTITRRFGGKSSKFEVLLQQPHNAGIVQTSRIALRWFNQGYLAKMLPAGTEVIAYGKPKDAQGRLVIDHPDFEVVQPDQALSIHLERIVPVYKSVTGISGRRMREILFLTLEVASERWQSDWEYFSPEMKAPNRMESMRALHFPEQMEDVERIKHWFALEEFTRLQLEILSRRMLNQDKTGMVQGKKTRLLTEFYKELPFDLTGAQKRSVKEIAADMRAPRPMHRLLQGDVGSGKTLVALCSILLAVESGNQAALMAPTQILAEQHFLNFEKLLQPLGVTVQLVTGQRKTGTKDGEVIEKADVYVGTHALLYDHVAFERLSLVIIDEQHKFGVNQREKLASYTPEGQTPDVLVMTATPIPRTLTLTLYGDLDVSILDERPAGRGKVVTALRQKPKINELKKFLQTHLEDGRQVYLVYPLVEESENVKSLAAVPEYEKWKKRLKNFEVELLHGKLPAVTKEQVMEGFRDYKSQVLVATSVIEVGIDVGNANIMIIFNAERFGLAQLHQLRGRVGRGAHKSYCILIHDGKSPEATEKLQVMERTDDGFELAEEDLRIRGPGDVLGTEQSGFLADLKFADYLANTELIKQAREVAQQYINRS